MIRLAASILIVSFSFLLPCKKKALQIALQKTTIQQLQLHPLHPRRKTWILMASLAVKSEARAVKMIYSRWMKTVSEKNNKRFSVCYQKLERVGGKKRGTNIEMGNNNENSLSFTSSAHLSLLHFPSTPCPKILSQMFVQRLVIYYSKHLQLFQKV